MNVGGTLGGMLGCINPVGAGITVEPLGSMVGWGERASG
jgi:hypothetical protein